jgi:LPXTG-motif cell wall-anchored protein
VHTNTADNRPGPVIGNAFVKAGTSRDVSVTLNPAPAAGDKLWPMLHIDAGTLGTYEFPGPDAPVVVGGNVVMQQITIAAAPAAQAPAATAAPAAQAPAAPAPAATAAPAAPPAALPNTGASSTLPAAIVLVIVLVGLGFGLRRRAQAR